MNNRYKTKKSRVPEDSDAAYASAIKTAMNIVAYKDNTFYQLRKKLEARGYSAETVDSVCDYMVMRGYVDDARTMFSLVRTLALTKLYGKKRIRQEIALRNFSSDALERLDFDGDELCDIEFSEVCLRLLKKKGGQRDEKTYAFLLRYGHSVSDIKKAYQLLQDEQEQK